mmetsp:Transcript_32110/g.102140  ORF Transcript_32110/g.102140 Transcript_32110/m.102140 type:complete len:90 (+) Transcript_32110:3-272(+)
MAGHGKSAMLALLYPSLALPWPAPSLRKSGSSNCQQACPAAVRPLLRAAEGLQGKPRPAAGSAEACGARQPRHCGGPRLREFSRTGLQG